MTAEAVKVLGSGEDLDACFLHLGAVDETAHVLDCGPEYRRVIETADRRLGRLLAAVRERPDASAEAWTIIIVTDHGHREEGGHGGGSAPERTAWIAASGPGITPASTPHSLRHADVAAHAYAALGITPDPHWTLDGGPSPPPRR
ncbi:alkaline phosphatase family protein [Streptomyces niphimycinicus]|uniref:alkaline phosphatase family protein n=1 Tax=Streptomyces niphimycinicus TaxID=2842201 RepID=UPI00209AA607|nr:alkaline phosphatase family protein [Streptomyces niphimycinicus]